MGCDGVDTRWWVKVGVRLGICRPARPKSGNTLHSQADRVQQNDWAESLECSLKTDAIGKATIAKVDGAVGIALSPI